MIATLWLADVGGIGGVVFRAPKASRVEGLRFSAGGAASKLRTSFAPRVVAGRAAWFAIWDDEDSLDRFLGESPKVAARFADGCRLRLSPDRIIQRNATGFDDEHLVFGEEVGGPVLVVTVNRPKRRWLLRFLRAAVPAEQAASARRDLRWVMGFARPPGLFATVTLWDSADAAADYAYGDRQPEHRTVMQANSRRWFVWTINMRARVMAIEGDLATDSPVPHLETEDLNTTTGRPPFG